MKVVISIRKELINKVQKHLESIFCDNEYLQNSNNSRPIIEKEKPPEYADLLGEDYQPSDVIIMQCDDSFSKEDITEKIWRHISILEVQDSNFNAGVGYTLMVRFQ